MQAVDQSHLPAEIDPFRFADREVEITGQMPLHKMPRLVELLAETEGDVAVSMRFGRDNAGRRFITGCIDGQLQLMCQRCGQSLAHDFSIVPHLSPVLSEEQAKQLPGDYDPLVTNGESVTLVNLVEDEIILSLPMIPKHNPLDCSVAMPQALIN